MPIDGEQDGDLVHNISARVAVGRGTAFLDDEARHLCGLLAESDASIGVRITKELRPWYADTTVTPHSQGYLLGTQLAARLCPWRAHIIAKVVSDLIDAKRPLRAQQLLQSFRVHSNACATCAVSLDTLLQDLAAGFLEAGALGDAAFVLEAHCDDPRVERGHGGFTALTQLRNTLSLAGHLGAARKANERLLALYNHWNLGLPPGEVLNQASFAIDCGNLAGAHEQLMEYGRLLEHGGAEESDDYWHTLGCYHSETGHVSEARVAFEKAANLSLAHGAHGQAAESLQNVGAMLNELGLHEQAIKFHLQAIELFGKAARWGKVAATCVNLGNAYAGLENRGAAIGCYAKAAETFRALGDRVRAARALTLEAGEAVKNEDATGAERLLNEVLSTNPAGEENTVFRIQLLGLRAGILSLRGCHEEALALNVEAMSHVEAELERVAAPGERAYAVSTKYAGAMAKLIKSTLVARSAKAALVAMDRYSPWRYLSDEPPLAEVDIPELMTALGVNASSILVPLPYRQGGAFQVRADGCEQVPTPARAELDIALMKYYDRILAHLPHDLAADEGLVEAALEFVRQGCAGLPDASSVFIVNARHDYLVPWSMAVVEARSRALPGVPNIVGCVPSARAIHTRLGRQRQREVRRALVIGNPANSMPPLASAREEAVACGALLAGMGWDTLVLTDQEATKESVLRALKDSQPSCCILATHADAKWHTRTEWVDPRKQSIWLGGDEPDGWLRVEEILSMRDQWKSVEMLWLNACGSASPSWAQLGSHLSLANAFLSLGVECVAGNLWSVFDDSAFALALMTFSGLATGMSVTSALTEAQVAMRTGRVGSVQDLVPWASTRGPAGQSAMQAAVAHRAPKRGLGVDMRGPVHWAGLSVYGNGRLSLCKPD